MILNFNYLKRKELNL